MTTSDKLNEMRGLEGSVQHEHQTAAYFSQLRPRAWGDRGRAMKPMLVFDSRPERTCEDVLGVAVDALSWSNAVDCIFQWALRQESRIVCICDVHSLVLASQDRAHSEAMKS